MDPKEPGVSENYTDPEPYEVRRHNGQCAYGPWINIEHIAEHGIPTHVEDRMWEDILESDDTEDCPKSGKFCMGGQWYIWREVDHGN